MVTLATLCMALYLVSFTAGLALAHLLQWAPKRKLAARGFLNVQQTFYAAYGPVAGLLEAGAVVACIVTAFRLDTESGAYPWVLTVLACLTLMFLVWAALIEPINRRVSKWTAESLPPDWAAVGVERWHILHTIRLGLAATALVCLIVSILNI